MYLLDLSLGRSERLGAFPGMTFAPRFGPDGKSLIMSLADDGTTDIYLMDLQTLNIKRLTKSSSIDTSPSFSPNGKRIVFNSDRGGSQQLYIMEKNEQMLKEYHTEKEDMQHQYGLKGRYYCFYQNV